MNNKVMLLVLFILAFGRMTYSKIESENLTSEFSKNRNLLAASNQNSIDSKRLNEAIKQINNLLFEIKTLKTKITKLETSNNQLQKNLTNQIKQSNTKIKSITETIDSITQNIPQTFFYGPIYPPFWQWTTASNSPSTLIHPTSTKLTIAKKSLVTLTINAHIWVAGQHVNVLFFLDNQQIGEKIGHGLDVNGAYFTNLDNYWAPVSLQQVIEIQPGTYNFAFGILCNECNSKPVHLNGISYSIKVLELTDKIIVKN